MSEAKRVLIFGGVGLTCGHLIGAVGGGDPWWWWIAITYGALLACALYLHLRGVNP